MRANNNALNAAFSSGDCGCIRAITSGIIVRNGDVARKSAAITDCPRVRSPAYTCNSNCTRSASCTSRIPNADITNNNASIVENCPGPCCARSKYRLVPVIGRLTRRPQPSTSFFMSAASPQLPSNNNTCTSSTFTPDVGIGSPNGCNTHNSFPSRTTLSRAGVASCRHTCVRAPVTTRWIRCPVLLGRKYSRECIITSTASGHSTTRSPSHTHHRGTC